MSNSLESTISIDIDVPANVAENPIDWLCEIVRSVVSERDDSIDMDELRDSTEMSDREDGLHLCLNYDGFTPYIEFSEDEDNVFGDMTARIKEPLLKAGAAGTLNIHGYYTERDPDASSYVLLEQPPAPTAA